MINSGPTSNRHIANETAAAPASVVAGVRITLLAACLASIIPFILQAQSAVAEEEDSDAVNPLNPTPVQTPTRSGNFGNEDASQALEPPARLRVGDFALKSRVSFSTVYDDNIEADDDERDEDIFFSLSPSVRAQSLYARHSIGFDAGATAATALKNEPEDIFDWRVGADGRLDLSKQDKVDAAVSYRNETEDDESIDADDDQDDILIHLFDASIGYRHAGQTVGYSLGTNVARRDGDSRVFDDRDRTTLGLRASTSYAFSDRVSLFLGPSYSYAIFDEDVAEDGEGRNSQIINLLIGGSYKASRTISTNASIGYAYTTFDDSDRDDDDSAIGNIGLTWDAGAGFRLRLGASQSLGVTIVDGEDTRKTTTGFARLGHRLTLGSRSAISSSITYRISDYSDFDRTDRDLGASLSFGYRLTEHAFFNAGYRFSRRDSDEDDAEYYRNLISLGVSLSY